MSAKYCTCFHRWRSRESSLLNKPGSKVTSNFSNNRWLGVKGSLSFGSLDTVVMGQLFMILSTSHIKVTRLSSSVVCSRSRACGIVSGIHVTTHMVPFMGFRPIMNKSDSNGFNCGNTTPQRCGIASFRFSCNVILLWYLSRRRTGN